MWPFSKKRDGFPELEKELLVLCEEWFERQIGHLPKDELPARDEIEEDIVQMRDGTYQRIIAAVPPRRFLDGTEGPDDRQNRQTLAELLDAYRGHERTTPIFVALALSKVDDPRYQQGWPLAAIRLIAEVWLDQSTS